MHESMTIVALYLMIHVSIFSVYGQISYHGKMWCNGTFNGSLNGEYNFELKEEKPALVSFDMSKSSVDITLGLFMNFIHFTGVYPVYVKWNYDRPKMEAYLGTGDYIIQVNFREYNFSTHWEITIDCLDYAPYKIINSTALTIGEAQSECEKTFGTSLATIPTTQDLANIKYIINTVYSNMTDIQIWIGGYNNIMNRNQWEWIAPYKYTIYTYGQLVMGDYPYICNENCTDQEGID
eukprot:61129_1